MVSPPYMLSLNRCLVIMKSVVIDGVLCFLGMTEDSSCDAVWVNHPCDVMVGILWDTLEAGSK